MISVILGRPVEVMNREASLSAIEFFRLCNISGLLVTQGRVDSNLARLCEERNGDWQRRPTTYRSQLPKVVTQQHVSHAGCINAAFHTESSLLS